MSWQKSHAVNIEQNEHNPPNCPQFRPIEKYWAIIKKNLLKSKKEIKHEQHFKRIWSRKADLVADTVAHRLMRGFNLKLRHFVYYNDK